MALRAFSSQSIASGRTRGRYSDHWCRVRLFLLEFGEQQGFLAGLGQFREMVLHAGLDMPAAGLKAGAFLFGVGLAGFGDRHVA